MVGIPHEFPPSPPNLYRVGWRGFSLILPNDWNLRLQHGDDQKGALLFADLRTPRLEIRWQSPKNPEAAIAKLARRRPQPLDTTLIPSRTRLYELHFPTPAPPDLAAAITDDFRKTLPRLGDLPHILWQLYGLTAWLPRSAQLQSASLLPGQTTLTFRDRASTLTLASLSLADRLLQQRTLKQWAQQSLPDLTRHPNGHWQESPTETTLTLQTRHLLRKTTHHLTLTHDPQNNRLTYTHRKTR